MSRGDLGGRLPQASKPHSRRFDSPLANSDRNTVLQTEAAATRAHRERELPIRFPPALRDSVPNAQIVPRERERDGLVLVQFEVHVREAADDAGGLARARGEVQIQLRDPRAGKGDQYKHTPGYALRRP